MSWKTLREDIEEYSQFAFSGTVACLLYGIGLYTAYKIVKLIISI